MYDDLSTASPSLSEHEPVKRARLRSGVYDKWIDIASLEGNSSLIVTVTAPTISNAP